MSCLCLYETHRNWLHAHWERRCNNNNNVMICREWRWARIKRTTQTLRIEPLTTYSNAIASIVHTHTFDAYYLKRSCPRIIYTTMAWGVHEWQRRRRRQRRYIYTYSFVHVFVWVGNPSIIIIMTGNRYLLLNTLWPLHLLVCHWNEICEEIFFFQNHFVGMDDETASKSSVI